MRTRPSSQAHRQQPNTLSAQETVNTNPSGVYYEVHIPGEANPRILLGKEIPGTLVSLRLNPTTTKLRIKPLQNRENISRLLDPSIENPLKKTRRLIEDNSGTSTQIVTGISFLPANINMTVFGRPTAEEKQLRVG